MSKSIEEQVGDWREKFTYTPDMGNVMLAHFLVNYGYKEPYAEDIMGFIELGYKHQ